MRGKRKLFFMFLVFCFMAALRSETALAANKPIYVNGKNILSTPDYQIPCGTGTATYDPVAKVLRLDNAEITENSGNKPLIDGIQTEETGVVIELIGENTINAHSGIYSKEPLTIRGIEGGKLLIHIEQAASLSVIPCKGIGVDLGGLTIEDADLQVEVGQMRDASAYAIYSTGGDNLINNSKIKIAMQVPGNDDMGCMGINLSGSTSFTINDTSIAMESLDTGISFAGKLSISGSALTIKDATEYAVVAGQTEILNGSELNISSQSGQALQAAGQKVTISHSSVNLVSTQSSAMFCNDIEIIDSSELAAKGNRFSLSVGNDTVIRNSYVDAVGENDVGIYCKGSAEITDSEVKSLSEKELGGFRVLGDITIKDSDITSSGNSDNDSIYAGGSISITGGTTEIGTGSISSGKDIYIGGVISSNGVPSYDNIKNDSGDLSYLEADYSKVDSAAKKAQALDGKDYTNFVAVEEALEAADKGRPLPFWEQDVVDGYADAIEKALASLVPVPPPGSITYEVVEGANQIVIKGENEGVTLKIDGELEKLVSVYVDGEEVGKEHYTATTGSTIITFTPAYIQTLAVGAHKVKVEYKDGEAQTTLTIKEKEETEEPPSGEKTYEVIEGANQTVIKGENKGVTLKIDGELEKLVSVYVDGEEVEKEHYTATTGSTIITFTPAYIQTLAVGVHKVKVEYKDGEAQTTLTIKEKEETEEPPSGEKTYEIIEGADQTMIKDDNKGVTLKIDGDLDKFVSVFIDGKEVGKEHYTAVSGSTIITFNSEYIRTLSVGVHTVRVQFTDGVVQTTLTMKEKEETEEPPNRPGGEPSGKPDNKPSDKPQDGSDKKPSTQVQNTKDANQKSPQTGDGSPNIWLFILLFSFIIILTARRSGQREIN